MELGIDVRSAEDSVPAQLSEDRQVCSAKEPLGKLWQLLWNACREYGSWSRVQRGSMMLM